ncbi:MAG: hypothetical protein E3J34_01485, partial [Dehalococcoidia bacterium]
MRKILFVPFYDNHIRVLAPVMERLSSDGNLEPLVLFLERIHSPTLSDFMEQHHLPYLKVNLFPRSLLGERKIDV